MSTRREKHAIDPLLESLPVSGAPEALWDRVQAELARPVPAPRRTLVPGRPVASRFLAAAAMVVALLGGAAIGTLSGYRSPGRWEVSAVAGTPTVAGAPLVGDGELGSGEWLVTDAGSAARLEIGGIGVAEVRPDSRIRLERSGRIEHRLTLAQGSIHAFVDAPPRLFLVETPTALATDLGCAYTLEVDADGVTRIFVTSGWVELEKSGRASLVAAGLVAEVGIDGVPGTPYPHAISPGGRDALARLDAGSDARSDLETAIAALYPQGLPAPARAPTTITLWHLIQRLDGALRARAFEALARVAPPPDGVTREGILALDRPMLEHWRRDLVPMWGEEDVSLVARAARRLWAWTIG